jgi:hypothetical protein
VGPTSPRPARTHLSRHRRAARLVAAAFVAVTALASGCNSAGGPNQSANENGPTASSRNGTNKLDRPLRARPAIHIASRVNEGWSTWDTGTHLYASDYAFPAEWKVTLDGCQSSGQIARYWWLLIPRNGSTDDNGPVTTVTNTCKGTVSLPRLGEWAVRLTVESDAGERNAVSRLVTLRDLLVVSIGDSLGSGEGNPDRDKIDVSGQFEIPAEWKDRQCHRSARSWSARLARDLESATTTVTFLNYACSGAEVRQLFADTYEGIEAGPALQPQLDAVERQLGSPLASRTPEVDVLLLSAGVNDLGFGDLLEHCATHIGYCASGSDADRVWTGLKALPDRYSQLDSMISTRVKAAGIYVVEYPAHIFTDDYGSWEGCGAFEPAMRPSEAEWIGKRGDDLNSRLWLAAQVNRWTYIPGIRKAFLPHDGEKGHGYCASDPWFRSYSGSKSVQGNNRGTAHPISPGIEKIAAIARQLVDIDATLKPLLRVRIQFLSVRFDDTHPRSDCDDCHRVHVNFLGRPALTIAGEKGGELPLGRTIPIAHDVGISFDTYGETLALTAAARAGCRTLCSRFGNRHGVGTASHKPRTSRPLAAPVVYLRRAGGWQPHGGPPGTYELRGGDDDASFVLTYRVTAASPSTTNALPQIREGN